MAKPTSVTGVINKPTYNPNATNREGKAGTFVGGK